MAPLIYGLCALVAILCAILLSRAYAKGGYRLLLWGALCFGGLALNNVLLFLDKIVFPAVDLSPVRVVVAILAMLVLIYGLIWDAQ